MGVYITLDGGSGVGKGAVINWLRDYFVIRGKRVTVLRDNQMDPLRSIGKDMVQWSKENDLNINDFLLPLFAAGYRISDEMLLEALGSYDIVLRDRSFISSMAYVPASGTFTPEQIWDLYVRHLRIRVPDVAVVVDADLHVASARIQKREKNDVGLGGKMSGNDAHRAAIRTYFLALPNTHGDRLNVMVVHNNDPHTDDPHDLQCSLEKVGLSIVEYCQQKGIAV